jgi:hypothetical protein
MPDPKFSIRQELFWIDTEEIPEVGTKKTMSAGTVCSVVKLPSGNIEYMLRDYLGAAQTKAESALHDNKECAISHLLNPEEE